MCLTYYWVRHRRRRRPMRACCHKRWPTFESLVLDRNLTYHYRQRVKTEEEANEIRVVEDTNVFTEKRFYKNTFTPINASGALPSGTTFLGPTGLKQALLEERHSDLVRQTASKLLSYGLGRQLEYFDEPAVRAIIAALEDDGFRFRTLVKAIVLSFPFQYKKLPSLDN